MSPVKTAQQVIGAQLRVERMQRGLTLEALAQRAGVSYQYLSGIETGKENFSIAVLDGIAAALDLRLTELVLTAYGETRPGPG